jgi:Putative papain-like cysteine peptidase (DUF1796)
MSDQVIENDIRTAVEEGDHRLAAELWGRLRDARPDDENYWIEQITALERAYCWPEADNYGRQAIKRFPNSIRVALCHAHTAYQALDWQNAIDRLTSLRATFGAAKSREVLTTVLDQLFCYDQMAQEEPARALARHYWPQIREHEFELRGGIFEMGVLVPDAAGFEKWSSMALPGHLRSFYLRRLAEASDNRNWIAKNARDTLIISLGQNCLPWMLPNRWGLRPQNINMSPKMVFDFFPSVSDVTAVLIEQDFEPLLRPNALRTIQYPNKLPGFYNVVLASAFFHEKGPWWHHDEWRRLIEAYRCRIDNFRRSVRSGRRLYIYCVVGANNTDRVVDAYMSRLDDQDARLLIINVLKDPISVTSTYGRVAVRHIPYPEDYNWMHWLDYDSERGHEFEARVVKTIKEQIALVGAPV